MSESRTGARHKLNLKLTGKIGPDRRYVPGTLSKPGRYADGGGLYFVVGPGASRRWFVFYFVDGKRREMALGSAYDMTLDEARTKAADVRRALVENADPIEERRAARAQARAERERAITFAVAVDRALAKREEIASQRRDGRKPNPKAEAQWRTTLNTYALPVLGSLDVKAITTADIKRVLEPIWTTKTETATRVRSRIAFVLDWAKSAGFRDGDNPAAWTGALKHDLAAPGTVAEKGHHPAVMVDEIPAFFAALRQRDGMAARALEFAALTGARSGEVRGATWQEIDLKYRVWSIPAARMKAKVAHEVPLSENAVKLLESLPRLDGTDYVFWAARGGILSDMSLSAVMRRMHETEVEAGRPGWIDRQSKRPAVPHGLRSTFRGWCARNGVSRELAEKALAHAVGNAVEKAYARDPLLPGRLALMDNWARFCMGEDATGTNVVQIGERRA